ncbi:MAG: hypothetical protein Tsb0014_02760 [Pleurocapsa sp.]
MELDSIVLPHKLKNVQQDYQNQYNPKSVAIVEQKYQEEIKMFGYVFEK